MTRLPEGKTRLDIVRQRLQQGLDDTSLRKRGRLVVGIHKLREDPHNERKTFRNMDGLIASVKVVGLIEPITVTPGERDTFLIVTGHRRYRAARKAGLEQVEVLIREPESELLRRQKSVISNVQREDVGPVEMAEALQALKDEDDRIKSQDDLARLIGKDKTWVSGMLRILTLPPKLQKEVGASQLSISYDPMIRVARIDIAIEQKRWVEAILNGATHRDIREQIDRYKGKPSTQAAGAPHTTAKPKRVFRTQHNAVVIVQSEMRHISNDQCIEALNDALADAAREVEN